jgi:hypothetical protein
MINRQQKRVSCSNWGVNYFWSFGKKKFELGSTLELVLEDLISATKNDGIQSAQQIQIKTTAKLTIWNA